MLISISHLSETVYSIIVFASLSVDYSHQLFLNQHFLFPSQIFMSVCVYQNTKKEVLRVLELQHSLHTVSPHETQ